MPSRRLFLLGSLLGLGGASRVFGADPLGVHYGHTKPCLECGIPNHNYQFGPRSATKMIVSRTGVLLQKSVTETAEQLAATDANLGPLYSREVSNERKVWTDSQGRTFADQKSSRSVRDRWDGVVREFRRESRDVENLPPPDESRRLSRQIESSTRDSYAPLPVAREFKRVIRLYQLMENDLTIEHCAVSNVALQLHNTGEWVFNLRADQNRRPEPPEPVGYNPRLHIKRNEFFLTLRCLGFFVNEPNVVAPMAGKPVLAVLRPMPFWVENGQPKYERFAAHCREVHDNFDLIDRVELEFYYR